MELYPKDIAPARHTGLLGVIPFDYGNRVKALCHQREYSSLNSQKENMVTLCHNRVVLGRKREIQRALIS